MTEWGIDTLFNPGKRHMDEEKRRLQSTREEIGDSSGGRRIDLESGVVRISRRQPAEPAETEATEAEPEATEAEEAEASATEESEAQEAEPTAAATDPAENEETKAADGQA